jgi:hypothetical protein
VDLNRVNLLQPVGPNRLNKATAAGGCDRALSRFARPQREPLCIERSAEALRRSLAMLREP